MSDPVTSAVANQLAKTFGTAFSSPSQEFGALIADKIRALRYRSLLRIVQKAETQAKERGLHLKMPPVKFFVPFCEAASLEEQDDIDEHDLGNLWSELLISASTKYDPRHLMCLRILKEITVNEAKFFEVLINQSRGTSLVEKSSGLDYVDSSSFSEREIDRVVEWFNSSEDAANYENPVVAAYDLLEHPGIRFLDGSGSKIRKDGSVDYDVGFSYGWHNGERPNNDISMNVLEALNLGKMVYVDDKRYRGYDYALSFSVFHLTEMGTAILALCGVKDVQKSVERIFEED